jgi:hypothetical protein
LDLTSLCGTRGDVEANVKSTAVAARKMLHLLVEGIDKKGKRNGPR